MFEKTTDRQERILAIIKESIRLTGCPPSLRKICSDAGFSSTNGALTHIKALEKKGFIKRAGGRIQVVVIPGVPCPMCGCVKGETP